MDIQQLLNSNNTSFYLLLIWSLIWEGVALWKAARRKEKYWFIAIFVFRTLGLLEILYIFYFGTDKWEKTRKKIANYFRNRKPNDNNKA